jgi:WD40 repeat protein
VRLWNVETGALERTLTDATQAVVHVAISPDGRWLASAAEEGTVNLYRLRLR